MDIESLKGVGEKTAKLFRNLNINTIEDLICFYPRDYEDFSNPLLISEAKNKKKSCIKVKIISKCLPLRISGGRFLFKLTATDGFENIEIIFFGSSYNFAYSFDKFEVGKVYVLMGSVVQNMGKVQMISPKIKEDKTDILPVYRLCKGLTSKKIGAFIENAMNLILNKNYFPEIFPCEILKKYNLCSKIEAIKKIHFPKNKTELQEARKRLIFEEFFHYHLNMSSIKSQARQKTKISILNDCSEEFYKNLPFKITQAQKKVVYECLSDMKDYSMNRLLQGDVGSGKTVIAATLAYLTVKNGYQVALMAPTELLAVQHYETLNKFFEGLGVKIELICGSLRQKMKKRIYDEVFFGQIDILIGTHAIISDNLVFKNLGLIITDEQHRFGVNQRAKLVDKGKKCHTLVMSATPIPRSLAMIIYADLDISVLDQVLEGRQKIDTYRITSEKRNRMFGFIKNLVSEGQQAYIVCASIEENENGILDIEACKENLLSYGFKEEDIEIIHGKMRPMDKDYVMNRFIKNEFKILISTTVIEVGIDVPNATVMVIENAERFGISQLHQLRGRVGRGSKKSYCILVSDSKSKDSLRRFSAMTSSKDGFYLSEEDLKLRGPGDFFGTNQHGVPNIKMATKYEDIYIIKKAKDLVLRVLEENNKNESFEFKEFRKRVLNHKENKEFSAVIF